MNSKIFSFGLFVIGLIVSILAILTRSHNFFQKGFLLVILLAITVYYLVNYIRIFKLNKEFIFYSVLILVGSIIFIKYMWNLFFISGNIPIQEINSFKAKNLSRSVYFALFIFLNSGFVVLSDSFKDHLLIIYKQIETYISKIAIGSLILLFSVVVLYSPINVFISSAEVLDLSIFNILINYILIIFGLTAIGIILFKLSSNERKVIIVVLVMVSSILVWVYGNIIPGDFGALDEFVLTKPDALKVSKLLMLIELIIILASFISLTFLLTKFSKQVSFFIIVLNLMSFGQFFSNIISSDAFTKLQNTPITHESSTNSVENLLSFSTEQNVLVIMLDMFGGGLIPEILEKNSDIVKDFSGFTWYANTLSTTHNTFGSMPAITGGHPYTVQEILKSDKSIEDLYEDAYLYLPSKFNTLGWSSDVSGLSYVQDPSIFEQNKIGYSTYNDLYNYSKKRDPNSINIEDLVTDSEFRNIFLAIGLFKSSPFFLKSKIYSNSTWLQTNKGGRTLKHILKNYKSLEVFLDSSNIDSNKKTFKFITNELTHPPWGIDKNGEISKDYIKSTDLYVYNKELNKYFINHDLVYNSDVAALRLLSRWFDWMKENNIYNKTKIIIVSDHGYDGIDPMLLDQKELLDINDKPVAASSRLHPLLLVKDFDGSGDIIRSDIFLSNADVPSIALSALGGSDPIINPIHNRVLFGNITSGEPSGSEWYKSTIFNRYAVTDSIFNKENWETVK